MCDLLLVDMFIVEEKCLHRNVAQQEAKAHMELFCFEVDVLLPNRSRFHVFSNTLDCPLKDLLNLIIGIGAKSLRVLKKEVEVTFPEINLWCIIAERALEHFLSLSDWFARVVAALSKQWDVSSHVGRINRILVADFLEDLHVFRVLTWVLSNLYQQRNYKKLRRLNYTHTQGVKLP